MDFRFIWALLLGTVLLSAFSGPAQPVLPFNPATAVPTATPLPAPTAAPTPVPTFQVTEAKSQCNDLATMAGRISCRVGLKQYDGYYEPEECRVMADAAAHARCQMVYEDIQDCRHLPTDAARWQCVQDRVGLKSIADEKASCQKSPDSASCMTQLKTKLFWIVKFTFYNLEEKAERFLKFGLPKTDVVTLEVYLETQKQAFDAASSYEQKKAVLLDVKAHWAAFVKTSLEKLNG